ncbi:MAG TPA: transcriptional regulator [Sporomusaceae bacterium]|nr:transcriptional regulator [Sporomusaceae bacterium]
MILYLSLYFFIFNLVSSRSGLSQDELADKIGISKSYLSKIEAPNSTKAYSLDVLFAIADGLEVDVVNFFIGIEDKK